MEKRFFKNAIWGYIVIYLTLNLLFLVQFPMMHSDESWLSGLTRNMMQSGLNVSEPFFDQLPAYPNAVSIVFNFIQMAFITVFGYSLFTVRLVSLVFGAATLLVFYGLILHLSGSVKKSLAAAVILSFDIQFVYASHMARQDIIIAFGVVAVLYYIIRYSEQWSVKRDLVMGIFVGIIAGIHPNGLMVAACAGVLYLYYIGTRQLRLRNLLVLVVVVAGFAALYVGASYLMDKNFQQHYLAYGATLGVSGSVTQKFLELPNYFVKLFYGVSGTYYVPPIRFQLVLFAAAVAVSAVYTVFGRDMLRFLLPVVAVCAAVIIIGRYSQPVVIVFFPLCYLMFFALLDKLPGTIKFIAPLLLAGVLLLQLITAVPTYLSDDYDDYLSRIEADIPKQSRVLANLNSAYAFDSGMLLDYRNLAYLGNMSFEEYIRSRHITYIVYPEEMDYIYKNRPVWNIVYGNLYPYYEDMMAFLNTSCTLVDVFTSPYAMRITGYSYVKDWEVRIYRVEGEF